MRVDGLNSSYPLDRSSRPGSAATPLRESQREVEARREQPSATSASQGFEQIAQARRVQAGAGSSENLPMRSQNAYAQARNLGALAAYGSTASYTYERDASEVLGLDLYA